MAEVLLEVKGLVKRFGGVIATNNISFQIQRGDFLGIIGPNGSGKTTLVNLITGFVKPTEGKVFFKGTDITGLMPYKIADLGISRTFQMPRLFYHMPAFKNLIIPLKSTRVKKILGGDYGERDDMAIDLLDDMGFERDSMVPFKETGNLPHGYLKRLDLARALALRPELLILDELFSGMSMSEVAGTLPIIERLVMEGMTIVMIEHRLKELFRVAKKVMVLNFGEKIMEGTPQEIMADRRVREAYLGVETEEESLE